MKNHRALRQARSARRRYVEEAQDKEEEEEEIPTLSLWAALVLLVGVTVCVLLAFFSFKSQQASDLVLDILSHRCW